MPSAPTIIALDVSGSRTLLRLVCDGVPGSGAEVANGGRLAPAYWAEVLDAAVRLAAGREKVDPSDMEIDIIRKSFGVPESAEPQRKQVASTNPKSKRVIIWHVVEVQWVEVRQ